MAGRLTHDDSSFLRDGEPHRILSGAIHYSRVHPEQWADRLTRLRALGLNTVETYVPWNFHEPRRGEVDFTGWRDLAGFVRTAGDLGLDVIVRPGPYICAEWDFGGLPAWLLGAKEYGGAGLRAEQLRTSDPAYLAEVDRWFDAVIPQIVPLQSTNGGPVVAVQVENEYGSYGGDKVYLEHCRAGLVDRGIDVLLFTSDGPEPDMLASGTIPGVLATANFGSRGKEALAELEAWRERAAERPGPFMCMELWIGWFDHWGEEHHTRDPHDAAAALDEVLAVGGSANLYMAHGGTSFGLWAGANADDPTGPTGGRHQPTVTSYDYAAPVGEAGELAEVFHAFRDVIARYAPVPDEELPPLAPRLAPASAGMTGWARLRDVLDVFDAPVPAPNPLYMEDLGQMHGLVHYVHEGLVVPEGGSVLHLDGLGDRAVVLVDGAVIGTAHRDEEPSERSLPLASTDGRAVTLEIVVENDGRTNYGPLVGERKGVRAVRMGRRYLHGWTSRALRLDDEGLAERLTFGADVPDAAGGPVLARTELTVDEPADGFLALPGWGRGVVWLNGFLLGRHRAEGPQVTLYAPAPLWRAGANEVVVLEIDAPGDLVELRDAPELG